MGKESREPLIVRITVEGGVIQNVEKPDSVKVEVFDFDIESTQEADLRKNEKGEEYVYSEW